MRAHEFINEEVDPQTLSKFETRVHSAVEMIARNADRNYQEFIRDIPVNITNGSTDKAWASGNDLNIDAEEFFDAPAMVLIFVLAHEIGHIIYRHTFKDPDAPDLPLPQQRQEELDADKFATQIATRMGITKIAVWTWFRRKKNDLEAHKQRQDAAPPGTHPTYNQRTDQARTLGLELTKANTDQIDQAMQHMA
jgi:hypothetical protein